ncbi:phosphatase PAP2 family protein [Arthrobacter sp. JZ12]|uniref:phosphatase PAP2 family protein n=1 Tax=Arthrobacter sp. JZ12 TaxID=2654190 RepID=UPI002B484A9E|nr:phosphatase PAP2 family protein [Arthrobacter sp. JZ12]WRH26056.1 phosphatase PAP2 family protein [Arthrobacter sp. JZ12]
MAFQDPEDEDSHVGTRDLTRWQTPVGSFLVACVRQLAKWIGHRWALLALLVVGIGGAVALTVASAEVYEAVADRDGIASLDQPALDAAIDVRSPWLNGAATAFTHLGGPVGMPVLAGTVTLALTLVRRSFTPLILMGVGAAGSLLMTVLGKDAIGRLRPDTDFAIPPFELSPSFPSGHTLNAVVLSGIVAYLLMLRQRRKRTRALTITVAVVFAFVMGLTRVYLGHHWLTDVAVAWTLGLAWLALVITAHRLLLTFRNHRRNRPGAQPGGIS